MYCSIYGLRRGVLFGISGSTRIPRGGDRGGMLGWRGLREYVDVPEDAGW